MIGMRSGHPSSSLGSCRRRKADSQRHEAPRRSCRRGETSSVPLTPTRGTPLDFACTAAMQPLPAACDQRDPHPDAGRLAATSTTTPPSQPATRTIIRSRLLSTGTTS